MQGVVCVLQNRQKEGKGPLPIAEVEGEFMALWKVPFSLLQAGETDPASLLRKWPNKVVVVTAGDHTTVQLAKKTAAMATKAMASTAR